MVGLQKGLFCDLHRFKKRSRVILIFLKNLIFLFIISKINRKVLLKINKFTQKLANLIKMSKIALPLFYNALLNQSINE